MEQTGGSSASHSHWILVKVEHPFPYGFCKSQPRKTCPAQTKEIPLFFCWPMWVDKSLNHVTNCDFFNMPGKLKTSSGKSRCHCHLHYWKPHEHQDSERTLAALEAAKPLSSQMKLEELTCLGWLPFEDSGETSWWSRSSIPCLLCDSCALTPGVMSELIHPHQVFPIPSATGPAWLAELHSCIWHLQNKTPSSSSLYISHGFGWENKEDIPLSSPSSSDTSKQQLWPQSTTQEQERNEATVTARLCCPFIFPSEQLV